MHNINKPVEMGLLEDSSLTSFPPLDLFSSLSMSRILGSELAFIFRWKGFGDSRLGFMMGGVRGSCSPRYGRGSSRAREIFTLGDRESAVHGGDIINLRGILLPVIDACGWRPSIKYVLWPETNIIKCQIQVDCRQLPEAYDAWAIQVQTCIKQ